MATGDHIRPMLASKYDPKITAKHLESDGFLLMQPKIDGMRVLFDDGLARSRSWKLWTNRYLKAFARDHAELIHGWDGEMVPGHSYDPNIFRDAMSGLRSEDGSREFTIYLFDNWDAGSAHWPYSARLLACWQDLMGTKWADNVEYDVESFVSDPLPWEERRFTSPEYDVIVRLCPTFVVRTLEEIDIGEARLIAEGWEGGILRRAGRGYKWNRATTLEGALTKLKRFEDAEATIIGCQEALENQNEAKIGLLGYTSRTSHKGNLVPKGMLGTLEVAMVGKPEVTFGIGVMKGVTHEERKALWLRKEELIGKVVTFSHQGYGGGYDKPRTPVFLRFRDPIDM